MYKLGLGAGVILMGGCIAVLIKTTKKITFVDAIAAACMSAVIAIAMSEIL